MSALQHTVFDAELSVAPILDSLLTKAQAETLFRFFCDAPLFNWTGSNNDCEDRANAVCILLDAWGIANYKGWVFSGGFLNRTPGTLTNCWNYHVAALVAITEAGSLRYYVIDPATANGLQTVQDWAARITETPASYHCITHGNTYIFYHNAIRGDNWHQRNRQNYKWTIQGLAGINGVSKTGKAQLIFQKARIRNWQKQFEALQRQRPEGM